MFCCTGNELLYELTNALKPKLLHRLRFDLWDWSGQSRVAEYESFAVMPERLKYEAYVGSPAQRKDVEVADGQERIISSQSALIPLTNVTLYHH